MTQTHGAKLRRLVEARKGTLLPGAANALAARVIEELGFEAVYISGAGVTNTWFGMPDHGFMGLSDIANHTAAIRDAVDLPLICDIDTGFGNAVNVYHTIRVMERAGASAVQIEDQVNPKRCGHFSGKAIIGTDEMCGKIKAAADARRSEDFLIMARTDARAVDGFDAAVERCLAFEAAGADIIFLEAPESVEELRRLPNLIKAPQLVNIVVGGKTPALSNAEFAEMGFSLVLYANVALQAAIHGMQTALSALKSGQDVSEASGLVASFKERQRVVRKPYFDELEKTYAD
ncbi:oxaloacetate decarboxylase [Neotabrizicola sp. sgz301269]|uniref:isocitrate lyase/PEP mutase family protein n=1 Tax=Neotabrizicola sp. sgz301269 TaxID=3276282 RepID=UPI00376FFB92